MKKIICALLLLSAKMFCQSENYIITKSYKTETTSPVAPLSTENVDVSITYFDGLGRPMQEIAVGKSGTGTNMVTPIVYDGLGRSYREYLSAPTSNTSFDYVPDAENIVKDYSIYNGQFPYSEKLFDNSPLNRIVKQSAPGISWTMGSNHEIRLEYQTNKLNEVEMFKVNLTASSDGSFFNPFLIKQGFYPPNELYKTVTKDENWTSGNLNTTEEFKNKDGKVLLKRTYVNHKLANGFNQVKKVNTYYVYDKYGNLTFVIPPMVDVSGTVNETILNGLCYQYKYDVKNRLVEKKLPGKQWEFMVYDKLDRVIATSTATSPFNNTTNSGWLITKYDVFNRVVITAWMPYEITSATRNTVQNSRNLDTNDKLSEIKNSSASNNSINSIIFRYSNKVWPISGHHILTVNYYDDYNFPNMPVIPQTILSDNTQKIYYNNSIKPKGLNTGSWIRILENTTDILGEESYLLYDNKGRVVRTYAKNYLGGFLQVDSKIDFAGKTLRTETTHKKQNQDPALLVREEFDFTPEDRLRSHSHKINFGTPQLLATNEYNEIGQLTLKMVGGTNALNKLQFVNYKYNIRGWLTDINNVSENQTVIKAGDLFSFKINYDQVAETNIVTPLYNGNISESYWRTASSNIKRSYGYQYDNLNRLTKAIYQKSDAVSNAYNEQLSYDLNGNILTLARNGEQDFGEPATLAIDELVYTYDAANKNQLIKVTDLTNHSAGFSDGANNTIEYGYDNNGNMIRDDNKGIESITYNHLDLPTQIVFSHTRRINYLYNAAGRKQKKIVTSYPEPTTTTDYLHSFQYQNNVLEFFPHGEGYVKYTDGFFNYVFNYTDHLGNVRLSYAKDPNSGATRILEENHYYPFGLKHSTYDNNVLKFIGPINGGDEPVVIAPDIFGNSAYKYKYNGKEYQDELGLNFYDMDMRQYDPAIGRWIAQDPITHHSMSPYTAFDNNPVIWADPSGADSAIPSWLNNLFEKSGNSETNWINNGQGSFTIVPPGEIDGSGSAKYLSRDEDNYSRGVAITAPNGKKYYSADKLKGYTYSDGKTHNGQQKKAGVWSYKNNEGHWMWDNIKNQYILNTSDRGGAVNSFPSIGRVGTTYAGGENPKNSITGDDDYSQPPQNIADFGGLVHDKAFDKLGLSGLHGVLSPQSTGANRALIYFSNQVISMYNQKKIDPFTGSPVSKATMEAALNMSRAFTIIEKQKK